jgi:hypothetical protein
MFIERPLQLRDPVRRHTHVVVGEGDDRRPRKGNAGVAAVGQPLSRLEGVAEPPARSRGDASDHGGRGIRRVVVDDDHFVGDVAAL